MSHVCFLLALTHFSISRKAEGNDKYKSKDYRGAIEDYTRAIEIRPDPGYYTNRAAAHMMILQFDKVTT